MRKGDRGRGGSSVSTSPEAVRVAETVGKRTLTMGLPEDAPASGPVQRQAGGAPSTDGAVANTAAAGVASAGAPLPHLDVINRAFGRHDVSSIRAHTDGAAGSAAHAIGARAYATGNDV